MSCYMNNISWSPNEENVLHGYDAINSGDETAEVHNLDPQLCL